MPVYKIFLALLAMMIFGMNAGISKIGLQEFPPILYNVLRFLFIFPLILFVPRPTISWGMLLAIGFSLGILHLGLATIGMALGASAGTTVLIMQTGSLFAIGFSFLFMGSKPTRYEILGIGIGLIGLYWICAAKGTEGEILAIIALIGSTAMWGLGFVLVKKAHAPSVPTTVWMSIFNLPFLVGIAYVFEGQQLIVESVLKASWKAWGTVLFSSWVSMLGAGSIVMYLMRTEKVSKVVPYNLLTPLFGFSFSMIFLSETLTEAILIGGCWIIGGVMINQFGHRSVQWLGRRITTLQNVPEIKI